MSSFAERSYDAFVDDINGGLTQDEMYAHHPPTPSSAPLLETIYEHIQKKIEFYARLLFSSDRKLALHKCYCCMLEFE